ncbi:MAG: hypothetical protein IT257_02710 [Chitinophagaceae bacterium]|nr:hypothetical protein [Chitinophagaceae bacterium]
MESYTAENTTFSLETAGEEQLQSAGKWARFVGIVFIIFGSVLLFATILLLANFSSLMNEVIQLNGISEEMIDMLEKGGKYFIAFALILSAAVLFVNGVLLFRFGSYSNQYIRHKNESTLIASFENLKRYIYFSFIMACISAVLSLISTFVFFGS